MSKQYSKAYKQALIKRYSNGERIYPLCTESGLARSTFYEWLKQVDLLVSTDGRARATSYDASYRNMKI